MHPAMLQTMLAKKTNLKTTIVGNNKPPSIDQPINNSKTKSSLVFDELIGRYKSLRITIAELQ